MLFVLIRNCHFITDSYKLSSFFFSSRYTHNLNLLTLKGLKGKIHDTCNLFFKAKVISATKKTKVD